MISGGLLLIGFRAIVDKGFALPVFGGAPNPNQIYLAVSRIEGDHLSVVDRFEETDRFEFTSLPAPYRRIDRGDPWVDVFVWCGTPIIGEPPHILNTLGAQLEDVVNDEPLAAVDLLLAADVLPSATYERALDWLTARFGDRTAERWSMGSMATQIVRLQLRRAYAAAGLVDMTDILRVRLERDADRVLVFHPDSVDAQMRELWGADWIERAYVASPVTADRLIGVTSETETGSIIRTVKVHGDRFYSRDDVMGASGLRPGLRMTPELSNNAREAVLAMELHDRVSIQSTEAGSVVISVSEKPAIGQIFMQGMRRLNPRLLKAQLESVEGGPFDRRRVNRDATQLSRIARSETDEPVRVQTDVRHADGRVDITFRFDQETLPFPDSDTVMVVVSGARANVIARHLKEWQGRSDRKQGGHYEPAPLNLVVMAQKELSATSLRHVGPVSAVAWLADDRIIQDSSEDQIRALAELGDPSRPLLIIPALPEDRPSVVLTAQSGLGFATGVLVDTSIARSPLPRWGRRSVDRRIADVIVAALELIHDPFVEMEVASAVESPGVFLSWTPDAGASSSFASEATSGELAQSPEGLEQFSTNDRSPTGTRPGVSTLHAPVRDFISFAAAVVQVAEGSGNGAPPAQRPHKLPSQFAFPDLTAIFPGPEGDLLLSAERPDPEMIEAAAYGGALLARYTDASTIRAWARGRIRPGATPDEIAMPSLRRFSETRGLVVRGIDPRDIHRLPVDELERLIAAYPTSEIRTVARGYQAVFDPQTVKEAAVPIDFLLGAAQENDAGAEVLAQRLRSLRLPAKRLSDLAANWAPPNHGRRWCLEDGTLPARVRPLEPDQVAGQAMFTIDGDDAVPALFLSRIFSIWARATMTRSVSWPSRFAVTRTFETLPIPRQFTLLPDGQNRRIGIFLEGSPDVQYLAQELGYRLGEHGAYDRNRVNQLTQEIDRHLLGGFDLPTEATDIDILRRLIIFNG